VREGERKSGLHARGCVNKRLASHLLRVCVQKEKSDTTAQRGEQLVLQRRAGECPQQRGDGSALLAGTFVHWTNRSFLLLLERDIVVVHRHPAHRWSIHELFDHWCLPTAEGDPVGERRIVVVTSVLGTERARGTKAKPKERARGRESGMRTGQRWNDKAAV
jgi:hypothetical protein